MKMPSLPALVVLAITGLSPYVCQATVKILQEEPPKGSVRPGKIVYVDDGVCPNGEVKEITGGNQDKSIPRQVRCVKRPE